MPRTETSHLPISYLLMSVGLALAWALSGWLAFEKTRALVNTLTHTVTYTAIVIVVSWVASLVRNNVEFGPVGLIVFGIALGVAIDLARILTPSLEADVITHTEVLLVSLAFIVTFVVGFGMKVLSKGYLECFVVFVVIIVVVSIIKKSVQETLKTDHTSWLGRTAFVTLILIYIFLVWFSFLGGWQVFQ